jgi:2-polyprenyl-3-methyl-5-hydroxy-6-metoxy-1,4-benzoquinol methylase
MQKCELSPLTKSSNIKLFEQIRSSIIIDKYKQDLGIDVERFFKTEMVEIYECLDTGFKFYYPFDIVGDDKLYEELQIKHEAYYVKQKCEYDTAYKSVAGTDKVLEVGCGTGNFIQELQNKGIEAYGLELNKEAIKTCLEKNLKVYYELLEEHIKKHTGEYDVVCSFQVLEHVKDPKSFIEGCISAAKKGGKIILGVPNNNPYIFKRDKYHTLNMPPHHMGLWSAEAFAKLPDFFNIKALDVIIEPLFSKRYYLNIFLEYNNLNFARKLADRLPEHIIERIAAIRKWQGRNIVAIFEKI